MIIGGFILQPRKLDQSAVSGYPPHVREIWLYILRRANYKDTIVYGRIIKRGQLLTSYNKIIKDLEWKIGYRVEKYKKHHCEISMKALMKEKMIATMKTTRGLIITILNYDYYQDPNNYETDNENDNENDNETTLYLKNMKRRKKERIKRVLSKPDNTLLSALEKTQPEFLNQNQNVALYLWRIIKKDYEIRKITPTTLIKAKADDWTNEVRYMIERDNRTINEIREVITFLKIRRGDNERSDFWKRNILSTKNLRKHFERLLSEAKIKDKGQPGKPDSEKRIYKQLGT